MHNSGSIAGNSSHRKPFVGLVVLGISVLVLATGADRAAAQERAYVLPDGSRHVLIPSETEIGVVLRPGLTKEGAAKRVAASKLGVLEDFDLAPDTNLKLLRINGSKRIASKMIQRDPDVMVSGRVYRFEGSPVPVISTRRVLLKLRPELTQKQRDDLFAAYRITRWAPFEGLKDVYAARVIDESVDDVLLAERLADDPMTLWATPDFVRLREKQQVPPPADALFGEQWHLNNTGQTDGTVGADIDALDAWNVADGEGVVFGMFDDSCDVDHEDLSSRYLGVGHDILGPGGCTDTCFFANDGICDDGGDGAFFFDCEYGSDCADCGVRPEGDPRPRSFSDAHGTAVMGLAVAAANTSGVRGVSHSARFTASRGLGNAFRDSQIATTYTYAVEQGVDVHINSWGFRFFLVPVPDSPILVDAIDTAFREGRDLDGPGGDDPLGMVILFATGNAASENVAGFDLSTLPSVIGVGASDDNDGLASFSSFGKETNLIAPGVLIATTDVQDGVYVGNGYNLGGISDDIDPGGNYTGFFGGTSAACPIAAGVAGLVLSVNPNLTATDVRILMEHTTDRVTPEIAQYNGISGRSFKFGFGRVNAKKAVDAALESINSNNQTWPDLVSEVRVQGTTLSWMPGINTIEVLVVESLLDFSFEPEDGVCYDERQSGCAGQTLESLPDGVSVLDVVGECGGDCDPTQTFSTNFATPNGAKKFFGLYGRSTAERYGFGFPADSTGDFSGGNASDDLPPPAITIAATPLSGQSPLTVEFNGNAVSEVGIDPTQTSWDFDFDPETGFEAEASTSLTSHTYTAGPGETKTYSAVLRMTDVRGVTGQNLVRIQVTGPVPDTPTDGGQLTALKLIVDAPSAPADDRCQSVICGTAPFSIVLDLVSDPSQDPVSIDTMLWDLGDGTVSASQSVFHSYSNASELTIVLPVSVTVRTVTDQGIPQTSTLTELVTILPGASTGGGTNPTLPGTTPGGGGGSASPCGVMGLVPVLVCISVMLFLRLRFVSVRAVKKLS